MNSKIENENIKTVERLLKALGSLDNNDNFSIFREIIHPEFYVSRRRSETRESQQRSSDHLTIQTGFDVNGQEFVGIDKYIESLRTEDALSELKIDIYKILSTQNTVWVDIDISGVHNNNVFGIPPTNQFVKYRAMFVYEFKNGKIITSDGLYDHLTFLSYIGRAIFEEQESEKTQLYLKYLYEKALIAKPTSA